MRRRQSFAIILIGTSVVLRAGLHRILRTAHFRIQGSIARADDLIPRTLQEGQLLFLMIDTGQDVDSIIKQVELLRDQYPNGRIAIVADHYGLSEIVSVFRAGASGYFVDITSCDAFIKSIELVMMGQTIFPPALLSLVRGTESATEAEPRGENDRTLSKTEDTAAEHATAPRLSTRESSILCRLVEGDSNKCIARKVDIAEATVKVHVKAILRKIRVQNRTQAAIWAINNGWLTRSTDRCSPPANSEVGKQLPNPGGVVVEASAQLCVFTHKANEVEITPIDDHPIHKGINGRFSDSGRFGN
ncbi:LuxR C-terminal-related transcriptional regulator [Bradyrhizobium australiense]|uniref:Response regulator transcription factor n=1 Tax=Bradyrhizobium australiense TaxID=2721161 RepID=A0A7Y4GWM1_9BRAD|nr:response regulator transcription factor [Bradyrhizobium australiense]NOJ43315.1 response regulator transcription factor [Bradyrhizobium australiense]